MIVRFEACQPSANLRLMIFEYLGMLTFLFCTHFAECEGASRRWIRWLDYYKPRMGPLGVDRIFLIDDGSELKNIGLDVPVLDAAAQLPHVIPSTVVMFRFPDHLGRHSVFSFPGWWRSFTFCYRIAQVYSFSKIVHIESDAFVLTKRLTSYIHTFNQGWASLWCPRYGRPESVIQVICRDSFAKLRRYHDAGIGLWGEEICAETSLPFSVVESGFVGDRYGEYSLAIPTGADFCAQTRLDMTLPDET